MSGLVVLVTHEARGVACSLSAHQRIGCVHIEGFQSGTIRDAIALLKPDVVVTTPVECATVSQLMAGMGSKGPALVVLSDQTEDCPPPPRDGDSFACDIITLPSQCGQAGDVLAQICENGRSNPMPRRLERVLVVAPRGETASRILRGLLGCIPAIAPWLVDSVDLAQQWLAAIEFDCVILGGTLRDGHALDSLERTEPSERPPTIGICSADDPEEIAALARAGCVGMLTPRELQSRKALHQRIRDIMAAERTRLAAAITEDDHCLEVLAREQEKLIADARSDRLTGVLNRPAFDDLLEDSHATCQRGEGGYALLMIDIDNFKSINDRCGHQRGDEVLRLTAQTLSQALAGRGLLARVGGEEFGALCSGCSEEEAAQIAESVRAAVQAASPADIRLTVSVGLAMAPRPGATNAQDIFALADAALYNAKHAGRNRVVVAA